MDIVQYLQSYYFSQTSVVCHDRQTMSIRGINFFVCLRFRQYITFILEMLVCWSAAWWWEHGYQQPDNTNYVYYIFGYNETHRYNYHTLPQHGLRNHKPILYDF